MDFLYVKAIHVIFVVAWFAALFYIVRLFIYNAEAQKKDEVARPILTNQFKIMQRRLLYIIGWPAAIGTYVFGMWMLFLVPAYLALPWMWLKLIGVFLLSLYHLQCQIIFKQQSEGVFKWTSFKLRLFNELPTLLLVAIVFLVIVKSSSSLIWGMLGIIVLGGVLFALASFYKKRRAKEEAQELLENAKTNANTNEGNKI